MSKGDGALTIEMAAVLVLIQRAGCSGISKEELHNGASSKLRIDHAIESLKADGLIHRVDYERYCVTPDQQEAPAPSWDLWK